MNNKTFPQKKFQGNKIILFGKIYSQRQKKTLQKFITKQSVWSRAVDFGRSHEFNRSHMIFFFFKKMNDMNWEVLGE